jgi:hypothetical protein
MQAKVIRPFQTATQRFKEGDAVSLDDVGETLFYACTDAGKPQAVKAAKSEAKDKDKG